jgi:hypothetical protein
MANFFLLSTMATDLSPAAQQVFWEFNRAASGKPDDWHYLPAIAAALRAAADCLWVDKPDGANGVYEAHRDQLLAIAAELEQVANINTTETP